MNLVSPSCCSELVDRNPVQFCPACQSFITFIADFCPMYNSQIDLFFYKLKRNHYASPSNFMIDASVLQKRCHFCVLGYFRISDCRSHLKRQSHVFMWQWPQFRSFASNLQMKIFLQILLEHVSSTEDIWVLEGLSDQKSIYYAVYLTIVNSQ